VAQARSRGVDRHIADPKATAGTELDDEGSNYE
jgi:hypothetical protein